MNADGEGEPALLVEAPRSQSGRFELDHGERCSWFRRKLDTQRMVFHRLPEETSKTGVALGTLILE